jgi:4-hydroxyphenylpyruvate dioxygenase
MADLFDNPMGTAGFECVEYAAKDPANLIALFESLGFTNIGKHKSLNIQLFKQGDIHFLVNAETRGFAANFSTEHGPCACSMGFRVKDAHQAFERAIKLGATPIVDDASDKILPFPAIEGIGGSRIYLVDQYQGDMPYKETYELNAQQQNTQGAGLTYLDHLTHNVHQGNMDKWANFYTKLFNFREIRYFDIEGKLTGLKSRAMTSPCGNIRIPINESSDDKSQIEEYLREYKGEGIQHIALGSQDIYQTVRDLRKNQVNFQDTPDTYYEAIDKRVPGHGEVIQALKELSILVDGAPTEGQGILLQIFTKTVIGPIFFEIIQRKGNEGFGEGNFQALFESIELDQVRRGVI